MRTTSIAACLLALALTACDSDERANDPAPDVTTIGLVHSSGSTRPARDLQRQVQALVRTHHPAAGRKVVSRVVHVGCRIPDYVDLDVADGVLHATTPDDPPNIECYVAVTTVAVLDVPADLPVAPAQP